MKFTITLQHTLNDKVVATKSCDVTADNEDQACRTAIEIASSIQGGMFRVMGKGNHRLDIIKVESTG